MPIHDGHQNALCTSLYGSRCTTVGDKTARPHRSRVTHTRLGHSPSKKPGGKFAVPHCVLRHVPQDDSPRRFHVSPALRSFLKDVRLNGGKGDILLPRFEKGNNENEKKRVAQIFVISSWTVLKTSAKCADFRKFSGIRMSRTSIHVPNAFDLF